MLIPGRIPALIYYSLRHIDLVLELLRVRVCSKTSGKRTLFFIMATPGAVATPIDFGICREESI